MDLLTSRISRNREADGMNPGDTVRLKSGGPLMTIEGKAASGPDYVIATWFAGTEKKKDVFHVAALRHDEGRQGRGRL